MHSKSYNCHSTLGMAYTQTLMLAGLNINCTDCS